MTTATLANKPKLAGMAHGDAVYTYFMAIMVGSDGELWLDQTLIYDEPTGAFTTPVVNTMYGLVAVMSPIEQEMLISAARNANAIDITRIVSTTAELAVLIDMPYMGADEPTKPSKDFDAMMARLFADNPTNSKEEI